MTRQGTLLRRDLILSLMGLGTCAAGRPLLAAPLEGAPQRQGAGRPRLLVGAAKIDITPDKPVALDGYLEPATRICEGIHDRVYARAVAFGSGTTRLVLVSCDLCSLPLASYYQRAIEGDIGLRADELLLCAIHTHSGPLLTLNPTYQNNVEYTQGLRKLLVTVIDQALRSMAPAGLALGRGRSQVGVSRRLILPDGRVEMAPNPDGPSDPEVLVLQVRRPDGRPLATLFDYACHSRSLGKPNKLMSGDVLGIAEQVVEGAGSSGMLAAAFAGASADVDPASVVEGFASDNGRPPETVRLATLLGEEVIRASKAARELPARPALRVSTARVKLPPRYPGTNRSIDVIAAALGEVAFVGLDCEAAVEIGLAIKAASPFGGTFVISNCNGQAGYLPVARQYEEGGYEVDRTGFAKGAAELLVQEATAMLRRLAGG